MALVQNGRGSSPGRSSSADYESDHQNPHLSYGEAEGQDKPNAALAYNNITISFAPPIDLATIGRITFSSNYTVGSPRPAMPGGAGRAAQRKERETKEHPTIGTDFRYIIKLAVTFTVVNHTGDADTTKETRMAMSTEGMHNEEMNAVTGDA